MPEHDPHADPPIDRSFTNVLKLHFLAGGDINNRRNDVPGQISIYQRGIGGVSDNGFFRTLRFIGGDLEYQTKPMREKLEAVYEKGDKLYIIGFSRGSASARKFAVELYEDGLVAANGEKVEEPPIEFLGCFDTVAMQVKTRLICLLETKRKGTFPKSEDVLGEKGGKIPPNVKKAVHNVSLNDNRMTSYPVWFPPLLMDSKDDRVVETWFAGEHGDVGGTYYTKGIPDISCKYMQEWIESLDDPLTFIKAEQIHQECLAIDKHPEVEINPADLSINPDPTDKLHMGTAQMEEPTYRPVVTMSNNEIVDGTVRVHESVFHHMEAMEKKGTPYKINPEMLKTKVVIVGPLGEELEAETQTFAELLQSEKSLVSSEQ